MSAAPRDVWGEAHQELKGPAEVDPPELESLGAGVGYVASFPKAMSRITIDGVRQGRDGLRGEVRVEVGPFGDGRYRTVNEARLDLSSMSQRETWERVLRKREGGFNWDAILHRFCAAIIQAEKRLDKPPISLRDAKRPLVSGMALSPLILAGLPTLWYGDGGSAKSLTALAAAISLVEGVAVIGRLAPSARLRVLIADFEYDEWEHRENLRRLSRFGSDIPNDALPDITYLDCKGATLTNQIERIQSAARAHGAQFVIVDSISYAADGPLNDDETARVYYRALGAIGLPSLSTGHQPKNAEAKTPFGSVHWRNLARLVWHFQAASEQEGELLVKLTCTKANGGHKAQPLGLRFAFKPDSIAITAADPERMPEAQHEHWRQIQALLARENRSMTYEEIALALGLSVAQVKARISEHKDAFGSASSGQDVKRRVTLLDTTHGDNE